MVARARNRQGSKNGGGGINKPLAEGGREIDRGSDRSDRGRRNRERRVAGGLGDGNALHAPKRSKQERDKTRVGDGLERGLELHDYKGAAGAPENDKRDNVAGENLTGEARGFSRQEKNPR
jgi:hypothetical protein